MEKIRTCSVCEHWITGIPCGICHHPKGHMMATNDDMVFRDAGKYCPLNSQKYRDAFNRENEIVAVLKQSEIPQATCEQIEYLLNSQLPPASGNSEYRIDRAKIYANLSERGCPENTAMYVNLAKQELEIARALEDDEFENDETIEVVETYKRLNMQAAAEEIFETAKKLTNPAIDFILEVEKIINEQ